MAKKRRRATKRHSRSVGSQISAELKQRRGFMEAEKRGRGKSFFDMTDKELKTLRRKLS